MDSAIRISSSIPIPSPPKPQHHHHHLLLLHRTRLFGLRGKQSSIYTIHALSDKGAVPDAASSSAVQDVHRRRSSLESLFCYDKAIPEEIIEKPIGLSLAEKIIGENCRCPDCQAKGAVLCSTCSGSGLYVDSILESQGIIVKVRCLGCGGTGNIMCSGCGGRGHLGL